MQVCLMSIKTGQYIDLIQYIDFIQSFFLYRQQQQFWNTVEQYVGGFLGKKLTAKSCLLFLQKNFTIKFCLGSKYGSILSKK